MHHLTDVVEDGAVEILVQVGVEGHELVGAPDGASFVICAVVQPI